MTLNWRNRLALGALRAAPLHGLSRVAGTLASLRLPAALQRAQIRLFGRSVGVEFDEVRDPIDSFPSLQSFFTRALADGARPIDPAPDALVAPCDGAWGTSGIVTGGTLLQLKGRHYSLGALLGGDDEAARFEGGSFATFYLAPKDYHRFHTPCDVRITRARYLPGALWPVNRIGIEGIDGLYAQNERICAFMEAGHGERSASLCIVAVGATLVGKVHVDFDDLSTLGDHVFTERAYADGGHRYPKGREWGRFEFGSTLVLVAEPGLLRLDEREPGAVLRLGSRIGVLRSSGE